MNAYLSRHYYPTVARGLCRCIVFALFCFVQVSAVFAWDYGDGRHGSFVITTSTTIEQVYQAVRLPSDPAQYNPADPNAVPSFVNLTISNNATLSGSAWNGTSGGKIVLKAQGTVDVTSGAAISASGIGYRGGNLAQQGESFSGGQSNSYIANYGGGGGGNSGYVAHNGYHYNGAGGGGYGLPGSAGGQSRYGSAGQAGNAYGLETLDVLYLGSGGGGGTDGYYTSPPVGGNGGGAISIAAGYLQVDGSIQANGNNGVPSYVYSWSGAGGGSGGSVLLRITSGTLGVNNVTASGGSGSGNGGNGGAGRIRLEYARSYTGSTSPSASIMQDPTSDITPVITAQPTPQIVFSGSNASFSVGASGISALSYQWFFNNSPIVGATNQVLSLPNVQLAAQGNYSVSITNALMTVSSSNASLTVLDTADPTGDGIPNWWKLKYGLNANDPNLAGSIPTGDKMTYLQKYLFGLNPQTPDTNGDGINDYDALFVYGTDPLSTNTVGDGVPDWWKIKNGLNPLISTANQSFSMDGLTVLQDYQNNLDPWNPTSNGHGVSNGEWLTGKRQTYSMYDHDDRLVGVNYANGLSIGYIYDGNGNLVRQAYFDRTQNKTMVPQLWKFHYAIPLSGTGSGDFDDPYGTGWSNYQNWLAGVDPRIAGSSPVGVWNPSGTTSGNVQTSFMPTHFVVATGRVTASNADQVFVSADGNPSGQQNFITVYTNSPLGWTTESISVGAVGVTSIAIGKPTGATTNGIYAGLRASGSTGSIVQLVKSGTSWTSTTLTSSTSEAAFVTGIQNGTDLIVNLSASGNNPQAAYKLSLSSTLSSFSPDTSTQGLGMVRGKLSSSAYVLRKKDAGGLQLLQSPVIPSLPSGAIYNAQYGAYYFLTPSVMTWQSAENYANSFGGHLVTVNDSTKNAWVASQFPNKSLWIGLYRNSNTDKTNPASWLWSSGTASSYSTLASMPWNSGDPDDVGGPNNELYVEMLPPPFAGSWNDVPGSNLYYGLVEVFNGGGNVDIPDISATAKLCSAGHSVAAGLLRPGSAPTGKDGLSILYAFVDDLNNSGQCDINDQFVLSEYLVSGGTATLQYSYRIPMPNRNLPTPCYGITGIKRSDGALDILATGEPDGGVYLWSTGTSSGVLNRRLFSGAFCGKTWHELTSYQEAGSGQGLIGLSVDPSAPSSCAVVYWPSSSVDKFLATPVSQMPPTCRVDGTSIKGGAYALLHFTIWGPEGNPARPILQWQDPATGQWKNATVLSVDGYSPSLFTSTSVSGFDHTLIWNAMGDLGPTFTGTTLLRMRAEELTLIGNWSDSTPFRVDVTGCSAGDGIPDVWKIANGLDPNANCALGNPSGDGIPNLMKYALKGFPGKADRSILPKVQNDGSHLSITYTQVKAATKLTYAVEVSSDLVTWQSGTTYTEEMSRIDNGDTQTVTTRDKALMGAFVKRFIRLKVTANP